MANHIRVLGALAAIALILPGSALAQEMSDRGDSNFRGGSELGIDFAFSYNMMDQDNRTQFTAPLGGVSGPYLSPQAGLRYTLYINQNWAFEPVTSFSWIKEGDRNSTAWSLAGKLQYHFTNEVSEARWYGGLGGTFSLLDNVDTETQFGVTGELGVKLPTTDYFGWRVALGYTHLFENDELSTQDIISLAVGFSVTFWK